MFGTDKQSRIKKDFETSKIKNKVFSRLRDLHFKEEGERPCD